jgi:hypothetical protein
MLIKLNHLLMAMFLLSLVKLQSRSMIIFGKLSTIRMLLLLLCYVRSMIPTEGINLNNIGLTLAHMLHFQQVILK